MVTKESVAKAQGLPIAARIIAWATNSQEPAKFTSAPVPAIRKVLEKAGFHKVDGTVHRFSMGRGQEAPCRRFELGIEPCGGDTETGSDDDKPRMAA